MSDVQNEIDVYESRRFTSALKKLSDSQLTIIENEIDVIIANPEIGTTKKGDFSHLRVHKFDFGNSQALLGYSWNETNIEIYLLSLGAHENFYKKMKSSRKADIKLINS